MLCSYSQSPYRTSGLQLLTQIIIADITTLKWRGLVSSLISMPFIINAFVGANISAAVIEHAGWRWGCVQLTFIAPTHLLIRSLDGMFAILIPVSLSPLIVTLLWAENKSRKFVQAGSIERVDRTSNKSYIRRLVTIAEQLDVVGLLLLGASVALILLPLTLAPSAKSQWHNGPFRSHSRPSVF